MKKLLVPIITLIIGFAAGYYLTKSKGAATALTGPFAAKNSISQEEAQMLVDTFGKYGLEDAKQVPGGKGQKTRSSFIPLGQLDSLVAALDAEKKTIGTDGLRIYFGRYPKYHIDGKTQYEMAYHNTIVLVSTRDTMVKTKGGLQPVRIHLDYFGSKDKKKIMNLLVEDPQNRTELCPDNCDGSLLVCPDPTNPACDGCGGGGGAH
jgi:hypothetical protein